MPIILGPDPPFVPLDPDPGPLPDAAAKVYDRLAPYHAVDAENGLTLLKIVAAMVAPTATIYDVTRSSNATPGWGRALDPETAPAGWLVWLKQFNGSTFQPGDDEATQRARIKQAAGFYRGTERAIIEELQHHLTGTRQVFLIRRDGETYRLTIGSLATETSEPASVLDTAALAQLPAWDVISRVAVAEPALLILEADVAAHRETIDGVDTYVPDSTYATLGDLEAAFATIALLEA